MKRSIIAVIMGLMTISCSMLYVSEKNNNPYYSNLKRTSSEKLKPTKSVTGYDYTDNNIKYFEQNGYVMIGYSAIRSTFIDYQKAVNAGCWSGADVMLYKNSYVGTSTGNAVLPFYSGGDVYTLNSTSSGKVDAYGNTRISAYGSDGYAYGNSSSNIYGAYNSKTTTTITTPTSVSFFSVPYQNDYYDQYALYFVKKYFRIERPVVLYEKANTKSKELLIIDKNNWFEYILYTPAFVKIKYKSVIGYIINSRDLN